MRQDRSFLYWGMFCVVFHARVEAGIGKNLRADRRPESLALERQCQGQNLVASI